MKLKKAQWFALLQALIWVLVAGCAAQAPSSTITESGDTQGSYTLVSTGPGDADLITLRALKAIQKADVVICCGKIRDKLAEYVDFKDKEVVDGYGVLFRFYGRDCAQLSEKERSWRGQSCEAFHQKQNELVGIVRKAVGEGKHVVMLSGGDPTIYGPDMWTLKALKDLQPTVIAGPSALNAANAALKASLGEVIITAPFSKEGAPDTIEKLAVHEHATMVIFMPRDMESLLKRIAAAYPADMPIAVVSNAGYVGKEKVVKGNVGDIAGKLAGVDVRLSLIYVGRALANAQCDAVVTAENQGTGKFYLVGMGPGDADMATLRAIKVIEKADVVFAGRRLPGRFQELLAGKQVFSGYGRLFPYFGQSCKDVKPRQAKRERMSCEEYHQKQAQFLKIVREAVDKGQTVAMLDSGDPLIYGPCSWSLKALRDLPTEVVPGLSCFNAANAALQAGVTQGKNSHSVLLASGWSVDEMAVHQSTMVLFTMRHEFKDFTDALAKHYAPETPVAIVAKAGYAAEEKVIHGTLGTILDQVGQDKLPFEHLLYIGDFLSDGGMVAN